VARNIHHLPGQARGGETPGPRSGIPSSPSPSRPRRPTAANDNRMPAAKALRRALRLVLFAAAIALLGWALFR